MLRSTLLRVVASSLLVATALPRASEAQAFASGVSVDLAVTKTVDDATPDEGDTILYTVVVQNLGPDTATGVELSDTLPAGVTYVGSLATQGSYSDATGLWTVGAVAAAAADTLVITATVDAATAGQTIINAAFVSAVDQADSNGGNNADAAPLTVTSADLAVTKLVDDNGPNEGDTIVYTVLVANGGPDAATGVEIGDPLPAGITYVGSSATQGTYDDGTGVWTLGTIAASIIETLTITASVDAGTTGQTIVNTAFVAGVDQGDPNPANDQDSAQLTVKSADLGVTKLVDDAAPDEGDTIVYSVTVSNGGPDTATGVELTDVLPGGVTFVSSGATQGSYDDGTGVWTVGSIAPAGGDTLTITATVDLGTAGQTIVNTASVSAVDPADTNAANDSDSASLTVVSVDLAVSKSVDDGAPREGDTIVYTVAVANVGPDPATGVEMVDTLPAGVTFVSSAATQGSYDDGTGVWTVGAIATAAADTLTITATVDLGTAGQTIVNTASVSAVDQGDTDAGNDSDPAALTVMSVDLAVAKSVDDDAPNEGETIVYTVAVANVGPDTATGVEMTDSLPAGVTFVSSLATQGSYDDGTGIWSLGSIAAAGADTLTIVAQVDAATAGQTIVNTASVSAVDPVDTNATNDSDSASLTVSNLDLAVGKTVDDNAPNEGDTIQYTVIIENLGPEPATGVAVHDTIPAGVTFTSAITTQGSYSVATSLWTVGPLAAAEADTLTIVAQVDAATAGQTIVNTASVATVDQVDLNSGNDSDTASLTVVSVDLAVTKAVDDVGPHEGDTILYTVVVVNGGPDAATGVVLSDVLPTGVTFVGSLATQGAYDDGTGLWSVGSMAAAASDTLAITATVDGGTVGQVLVNTASVASLDQADPAPGNDSSQATITVQSFGPDTVTIDAGPPARVHPSDSLEVRVSILDGSGDRVPDEGVALAVTALAGLGTLSAPALQPDTSFVLTFIAASLAGVNVDTLEAFDPETASVGRDSVVVEITDHAIISSITDVPIDQGRQVRVVWERDLRDDAGAGTPIEEYIVWRRVDGFSSADSRETIALETLDRGALRRAAGPAALLRRGGTLWEPVGPSVPAVTFDEYASVVPTLADSTASGIVYSVFFVSAHTAMPQVFFDSAPDSGYSVDNLAPAAPTSLALIGSVLTWDAAPEPDFDTFTVYGSDTNDFPSAAMIADVTTPLLDILAIPYAYYFVTTSDFSGNESLPSSATNPATTSPETAAGPSVHFFHAPRPTPFLDRTILTLDLARSEHAHLRIYDVSGRLIRALVDRRLPAGRHGIDWNGRDAGGRDVGAGVYFLRLDAGPYHEVRKVVRLRHR